MHFCKLEFKLWNKKKQNKNIKQMLKNLQFGGNKWTRLQQTQFWDKKGLDFIQSPTEPTLFGFPTSKQHQTWIKQSEPQTETLWSSLWGNIAFHKGN